MKTNVTPCNNNDCSVLTFKHTRTHTPSHTHTHTHTHTNTNHSFLDSFVFRIADYHRFTIQQSVYPRSSSFSLCYVCV